MGERNAKQWRVEQRWTEEPDLIIPEKQFERNAEERRRRERIISDSIDELSYRSNEGRSYTRHAQTARDGKGSIRGEHVRKRSRYPKRRLLAGALAAVAIFGAAHSIIHDDTPDYASTALVEEAGINANELGLTPEIVEKLKEYEAFFENYNPEQGISEEEVLAKIEEIDALKDEVLSSKLGALFGVPAEEVERGRVSYDSDGQLNCSIRVGEDIRLSNSLLPIFKRGDISDDIKDLLVLFDGIDNLSDKVKEDRISKNKAVSRLGEQYFEALEIIANSEFVSDKHNNISVVYTQINKVNKDAKEAEKNGTSAEVQQGNNEKEDDEMEI